MITIIYGEFVKIWKFTLVQHYSSAHFCDFPQNGNLGLKIKILKFSGIQPKYVLY